MRLSQKNTRQHAATSRAKSRFRLRRKGAAVVELAVCTPVILLVSVALIELGSLIFLKQGLAVASYEAGHRAVQPAATAGEAISVANDILSQRNIQGASVSIDPPNFESLQPGELFTVTVGAPSGSNAIAIFGLFNSAQLESRTVVMKESEAL